MLLIKDSNKFHFLPIGIFVGLLGLYFLSEFIFICTYSDRPFGIFDFVYRYVYVVFT